MIKEETITKCILNFLAKKGWRVLSFDFPQSGTGISLKVNNSHNEKNRGSVTPDVIAIKSNILLILENKSDFSKKDLDKLETVKDGRYSESLIRHFPNLKSKRICIGMGLGATSANLAKVTQYKNELDAYIIVGEDASISAYSLPTI